VYFANTKKDEIFNRLIKELGSTEALAKLKEDYYNKRLAEFVLNKNEVKKIVETDHHTLFQVKDPIFMKPVTNNGRAHFMQPKKYCLERQLIQFGLTLQLLVKHNSFVYIAIIQWVKEIGGFPFRVEFIPKSR
jgi:hypothetical protein